MKKTLILLILFSYSYSYGYEQIYYPEEEYSPRYMIKDYSYIKNYNQLWQQVSAQMDISSYDEFIYKDYGTYTSRKSRDEVINYIKNYKIQTGELLSEDTVYPALNCLIIQNKALLKAMQVLDNVPAHDKTSLVYLAVPVWESVAVGFG